jgi:ABC-type branched-subunit amino acid transport system ATPase component
MTSDTILRVENLTHKFGGVTAVDGCSWTLERGSATAIIGPNGAGKSTLVDVISGALHLQQGKVWFEGEQVGGWAPHRIALKGVIRTFQIARDFENLTAAENMLVGPRGQLGESLWNIFFRPGACRRQEKELIHRALELLNSFDLYQVRNHYAKELSGGQRRLLEVARAVMCDPKVLILDEPMAGVSPMLAERITEHLLGIRLSGVTLLLVEHNLTIVERMCDWVTVMVQGRPLASGKMHDLRNDQSVIDAYLGREMTVEPS